MLKRNRYKIDPVEAMEGLYGVKLLPYQKVTLQRMFQETPMVEFSNGFRVKVEGGYLEASYDGDPDYPGIDIEYIPDDELINMVSRPRVLIEMPRGSKKLRALIWKDPHREDYTQEVVLAEIKRE